MSKDTTAKLKRLTHILNRLTTSKNNTLTPGELAKECSVSCRTVFRDLALLQEVGIALDSYNGDYYLATDFSFEKAGLTPQTAAVLCLAYEEAKRAGKAFIPTCRYILQLFSPNTELYEINPKLPPDPVVFRLQKAIEEKRYIKIMSNAQPIYAKPYCLIRKHEKVYLVFATTFWRKSVLGYELDQIEIKQIESVSFEAKSKRVKNGCFASLGVPKHEINFFIRQYFK